MTKKSAPWLAVFVLTSINLLNYIDRYIFSALLPAIKADLHFSDTQLGLLGSAFIFAYVFISPIFGWWGDRGPRSKIMALGVGVWSFATGLSGLARTFTAQLLSRGAVGVGESAYTVIASSTLADHFAKDKRGRVYAIYAGAIPVGSALGYVLGGFLEARIGWQRSFFVVGVPGLVLSVLLFFSRDPVRGQSDPPAAKAEATPGLVGASRQLFANGFFMSTCLGYAAYTFVVGGMAFWMPTFIVRYYSVSLEKGNIIFGGVTVAGGFIGTIIGGFWSDRWEHKSGNGFLKVSTLATLAAVPLFVVVLSQNDFKTFSVLLFFLEIALFICISPLEAAVVTSVRPFIRASAMAWNVFLIHVLGDGLSRYLIGSVSDSSGLKAAIAFCPWVLALASIVWFYGIVFYWQPAPWPKDALTLPLYQRHRGFWRSGLAVENSIEAFRLAKKQGITMIELDTHLSKDGVVVVTHDPTLLRLYKHEKNVVDLTAAELWQSAKIPQLLDVLTDPEIPSLVNIELKSSALLDTGLEKAVAQVIHQARAEHRVLVSSFNPFCLRRMSVALPQIPRALLVTNQPDEENKIYLRKMWLAFLARPHLLHLDEGMITDSLLVALGRRDIPVAAWTVNEPVAAQNLFVRGVLSVISDTLGAKT